MMPGILPAAARTSDSPDEPDVSSANFPDSPDYPGEEWILGALADRPDRSFGFVRDLELRLQGVADRALGDDAALDLRPRRDLEHRVEERLLDDRLQSPCPGSAQQRQLRDRVQRAFLEHKLDVVQREELLVLLHER